MTKKHNTKKRRWFLKVEDDGSVQMCQELWDLILKQSGSRAKTYRGQRAAVKKTFERMIEAAMAKN